MKSVVHFHMYCIFPYITLIRFKNTFGPGFRRARSDGYEKTRFATWGNGLVYIIYIATDRFKVRACPSIQHTRPVGIPTIISLSKGSSRASTLMMMLLVLVVGTSAGASVSHRPTALASYACCARGCGRKIMCDAMNTSSTDL